jgi:hypothetical protein
MQFWEQRNETFIWSIFVYVLGTTPHSIHRLKNDDDTQQFQPSSSPCLGSLGSFLILNQMTVETSLEVEGRDPFHISKEPLAIVRKPPHVLQIRRPGQLLQLVGTFPKGRAIRPMIGLTFASALSNRWNKMKGPRKRWQKKQANKLDSWRGILGIGSCKHQGHVQWRGVDVTESTSPTLGRGSTWTEDGPTLVTAAYFKWLQ